MAGVLLIDVQFIKGLCGAVGAFDQADGVLSVISDDDPANTYVTSVEHVGASTARALHRRLSASRLLTLVDRYRSMILSQ